MTAGDHRPRRRFGQNFLHDAGVIERMLRAIGPRQGDRVVEIGPGQGALTFPLLERTGALTVVELDRDLAAALEGHPGLSVRCEDVLAVDFRALAGAGGAALRVVGNLPYNISTPLLFHVLAHGGAIRDMHFLLQREVVDRMAAPPGDGTYGRLSVMLQFRCAVEPLFSVPPGAFRPAPRVTSRFVRLVPHAEPPVAVDDTPTFDDTVARAFAQRRKTLRNALRGAADDSVFERAGVDPAERAERLDLAAFARLANARYRAGPSLVG